MNQSKIDNRIFGYKATVHLTQEEREVLIDMAKHMLNPKDSNYTEMTFDGKKMLAKALTKIEKVTSDYRAENNTLWKHEFRVQDTFDYWLNSINK